MILLTEFGHGGQKPSTQEIGYDRREIRCRTNGFTYFQLWFGLGTK